MKKIERIEGVELTFAFDSMLKANFLTYNHSTLTSILDKYSEYLHASEP